MKALSNGKEDEQKAELCVLRSRVRQEQRGWAAELTGDDGEQGSMASLIHSALEVKLHLSEWRTQARLDGLYLPAENPEAGTALLSLLACPIRNAETNIEQLRLLHCFVPNPNLVLSAATLSGLLFCPGPLQLLTPHLLRPSLPLPSSQLTRSPWPFLRLGVLASFLVLAASRPPAEEFQTQGHEEVEEEVPCTSLNHNPFHLKSLPKQKNKEPLKLLALLTIEPVGETEELSSGELLKLQLPLSDESRCDLRSFMSEEDGRASKREEEGGASMSVERRAWIVEDLPRLRSSRSTWEQLWLLGRRECLVTGDERFWDSATALDLRHCFTVDVMMSRFAQHWQSVR